MAIMQRSTTMETDSYGDQSNNRAANNVAEKFIGALTELETARDVEQMVGLFADDCEVGNIEALKLFRGVEGARRFWTDYRDKFKDVCSVFQKELYTENKARLEWITEGKTVNGNKVKYEAVSILETEDQKITRFYALFDRKKPERQTTKQANDNGG